MRPLLLAVEEIGEEDIAAGPLGFLIVVLMVIAVFALIRNMNGRLKKLPPEFPEREDEER